MTDGRPVPVVAAVIRREDGAILLARRHPRSRHGGLWEFPGGKVEEGETLEIALAREIREELGVDVAVGVELTRVTHEYPHATILLVAHDCRILTGEPRPLDCWEVAWVSPPDLLTYPMPEADVPIARTLREGGSSR
jgi:8-oxo-dGTP diphosphatase